MNILLRDYALKLSPNDIILIGGLSRSGKTSLSNNLKEELLKRGYNVCIISLDRWLRNVESRSPGVLGRYDLYPVRHVIRTHLNKGIQNLKLPFYDKMQQRTIHTTESILIKPTDILIIEGTVALTYDMNSNNIKRLYIIVDELLRKERVINEYLSRGKSLFEAEKIYVERQFDETPVIVSSSSGAIQVHL